MDEHERRRAERHLHLRHERLGATRHLAHELQLPEPEVLELHLVERRGRASWTGRRRCCARRRPSCTSRSSAGRSPGPSPPPGRGASPRRVVDQRDGILVLLAALVEDPHARDPCARSRRSTGSGSPSLDGSGHVLADVVEERLDARVQELDDADLVAGAEPRLDGPRGTARAPSRSSRRWASGGARRCGASVARARSRCSTRSAWMACVAADGGAADVHGAVERVDVLEDDVLEAARCPSPSSSWL